MSQSFFNNFLASAARDLYKQLGKIFEKQTPQCFISRLDPDVILDDLIPYFDIKNILNLRKVYIYIFADILVPTELLLCRSTGFST